MIKTKCHMYLFTLSLVSMYKWWVRCKEHASFGFVVTRIMTSLHYSCVNNSGFIWIDMMDLVPLACEDSEKVAQLFLQTNLSTAVICLCFLFIPLRHDFA